jgi:hypothetical protein
MREWGVFLTLVLAACTDVHRSTLPPFVRDVRAVPGGLQLIQCEVVVTTTRETDFWGNRKTTREIGGGNCWNAVVSTEPPPEQPAPPPQPSIPPPPTQNPGVSP